MVEVERAWRTAVDAMVARGVHKEQVLQWKVRRRVMKDKKAAATAAALVASVDAPPLTRPPTALGIRRRDTGTSPQTGGGAPGGHA